jgi:hypothetical protein
MTPSNGLTTFKEEEKKAYVLAKKSPDAQQKKQEELLTICIWTLFVGFTEICKPFLVRIYWSPILKGWDQKIEVRINCYHVELFINEYGNKLFYLQYVYSTS